MKIIMMKNKRKVREGPKNSSLSSSNRMTEIESLVMSLMRNGFTWFHLHKNEIIIV